MGPHHDTRVADKRLFLFGSSLYSESPNDLDLLVVYEVSMPVIEALEFRSKLIGKLRRHISLPIHVVLLSADEEREIGFISKENFRLLTRQDIHRMASRAGRGL